MLNPGQAQPGGLGNLIAQQPLQGAAPMGINPMTPMLSQMPNDQFAALAAQSMQQTGIEPIARLAELAKRITAQKEAMIQQGLQAGAQMRSQPPTLKDQLEQQAFALGIGSQPYEFAGGGLVAFENGGVTTKRPPLTLGDIEGADLDYQDAFGFGFADPVAEAQALAADALRVENLPALRAAAFPPDAQELARQGRLIGIHVSPRDSEQVRAEKFQRIRDAIAAANKRETEPRAEIPKQLTQLPTDYQRRTDIPPGGIVSPGMTRSNAGTGAGAGAGAGTGTGTGSGAGRTRPPGTPAVPPDIAQYVAAGEAAIKGMEGRGRPSPEVLELRKAALAAQEAEREPRVEYKEPTGLTAKEFFQLASLDPTKGRWVQSLAEKAAGVTSAREAKAEEFRKLNREIDAVNRRLNTALAQQRLAYASGDQKAKEDADLAVLNARMVLREKITDLGFKSREVAAKEEGVEVERIKANAMRESAGEARNFRINKELGDAIAEAEQKINNQSMIAGPRRAEYIAADAARKEQILREERFRYVKERAGMFATDPQIRQAMNMAAPTSSTAPAAGTSVIRFDAQGNRIP